jgi:uncharacterized protein (TIGR03118 family)
MSLGEGFEMRLWITLSLAAVAAVTPMLADPIGFVVTKLASDVPGLAQSTDPDLVNAWGMASNSLSPFWLGANGTGKSVLYTGAGTKLGLVVSIPGDGSVTGVTFSNVAGSFNSDIFLFASEDGTVSGWRGALGTNAETLVSADPANVYKGIAQVNISGNAYAYLANFRAGTIDVLKGNAGAPDLAGNFTDPNLPAGYAPFDVQTLGGILYVTYAVQDGAKHDDVAGPGHGIVDTFNLDGTFRQRLVSPGGALDSPWGLALAPAGFGDVGGDLLVGNFGNGMINAFNPVTGTLVETLITGTNPIVIDGLWGLRFGNGGGAGLTSTLYFTAGPDGESHGLFGDLVSTPEPGTWMLAAIATLPMLARKWPAKAS